MKHCLVSTLLAIVCGLAAAAPAAVDDAKKPPPPKIFDLEEIAVPAGYHAIRLTAINDLGDTAGVVERHYLHRDHFIIVRHPDGSYSPVPLPLGFDREDYVAVTALNDAGQMLISAGQFYDPQRGWSRISGAGCGFEVASGLDNHGDVVGTCGLNDGRTAGFVWNLAKGLWRFEALGSTTKFTAINDDGEIAATVVDPDALPRRGSDSDQTAALVRAGHVPIYTGDLIIHSEAAYRDPANADHAIWSPSGPIGADGALGVTVRHDDATRLSGYRACVWTEAERLRCAPPPGRSPKLVGFGPHDALVYTEKEKGYAFLPALGVDYTLSELSGGSRYGKYNAMGTNRSGEVVGMRSGHGAWDSFIFHPVK